MWMGLSIISWVCDGLSCLVYPFIYVSRHISICFFGAVIFITVRLIIYNSVVYGIYVTILRCIYYLRTRSYIIYLEVIQSALMMS
jgi:voltage-gated potassium channel Kch